MKPAFSHLGICVSDVQRSLRFYCEALGFAPAEGFDFVDEWGQLMELEHPKFRSQFIQHEGGMRLELLGFESPAPEGPRVRKRMNQYGMTHLSFWVDDIDTLAQKIRELGGQVHDHTRTTSGEGAEALDLVYCSDPDGVRIELMKAATRAW